MRVEGAGFHDEGFRFKVWSLGFEVEGLVRIQGSRLRNGKLRLGD